MLVQQTTTPLNGWAESNNNGSKLTPSSPWFFLLGGGVLMVSHRPPVDLGDVK